ncbi:MAG TPA: HIT domain-containing protein [Spirochaetota bacterium]|mgnify:CR=1 FL=1|nr:HIT domain-containing protein [Spirochaetota bacterium]HPJ34729.1 HIT domain-containing protein [Spirochaetota bacterium]
MERNYLFNTEKIRYVKGDKPDVGCILCAIRDKDPAVTSLTVYQNERFVIAMNLFPFNPGHLMIFPSRHITDLSELSDEEASEMHSLLVKCIKIIDEEFSPSGYNIGYNLGNGSGASIAHIHQHVVPRYSNEVGFLDVLSGTRVIVSDPKSVMLRLRDRFCDDENCVRLE